MYSTPRSSLVPRSPANTEAERHFHLPVFCRFRISCAPSVTFQVQVFKIYPFFSIAAAARQCALGVEVEITETRQYVRIKLTPRRSWPYIQPARVELEHQIGFPHIGAHIKVAGIALVIVVGDIICVPGFGLIPCVGGVKGTIICRQPYAKRRMNRCNGRTGRP